MKTRTQLRAAFTLVELLTVIAIIGVLVGLIVPAVMFARTSIMRRAIAMETTSLADAVTKYEQKFNDLPPDGTNAAVVTRHLQKIYPQIASSELALIGAVSNNAAVIDASPTGVMDPAEALVFFLGGYSENAQYPISGVGGPIFITHATTGAQVTSATPPAQRGAIQYNTDRNSPFFDFKQERLSLTQESGLTISNDETTILGLAPSFNDVLPVYKLSGQTAPFVYFDQRTYSIPRSGGGRFFSHYTTANNGVARPYRSANLNTRVGAVPANADAYFEYVQPKGFQLLSAGLDDNFGGIPFDPSSGGGPVFYRFPSGESIDFAGYPTAAPVVGNFTRFQDATGVSLQEDNTASFAEGPLGESLAN
jgi:prepilin-type N-terminal cleavage/methylation domain-containing protein